MLKTRFFRGPGRYASGLPVRRAGRGGAGPGGPAQRLLLTGAGAGDADRQLEAGSGEGEGSQGEGADSAAEQKPSGSSRRVAADAPETSDTDNANNTDDILADAEKYMRDED